VDELILELRDPVIATSKGERRARAVATLVYQPADPTKHCIESRAYIFTAPIGPIELEEIRWYLEDYLLWPVGVFRERAERASLSEAGGFTRPAWPRRLRSRRSTPGRRPATTPTGASPSGWTAIRPRGEREAAGRGRGGRQRPALAALGAAAR
jgi:hypothetical protein